MAGVADELLLIAPPAEPPAGFEDRVAGALEPPRRRWSRLRIAVPALAAAACAAAVVWFALGSDRELANEYRDTLAVANGQHFEAAPVTLADGQKVGYVYGYQGRTSWVVAIMYDCPYDGTYELEGVTADGSTRPDRPDRDRRRPRQRRQGHNGRLRARSPRSEWWMTRVIRSRPQN